MKYEEMIKKCTGTGSKLKDYGRNYFIITVIICALAMVIGVFALGADEPVLVIPVILGGLAVIGTAAVTKMIFEGLGELVINSEITARNSCIKEFDNKDISTKEK